MNEQLGSVDAAESSWQQSKQEGGERERAGITAIGLAARSPLGGTASVLVLREAGGRGVGVAVAVEAGVGVELEVEVAVPVAVAVAVAVAVGVGV